MLRIRANCFYKPYLFDLSFFIIIIKFLNIIAFFNKSERNFCFYLAGFMAEHADNPTLLSPCLVLHRYQSAPLAPWFWESILRHPATTGKAPHITTGFKTIIHSTNYIWRWFQAGRSWANANRARISQMSCWNKVSLWNWNPVFSYLNKLTCKYSSYSTVSFVFVFYNILFFPLIIIHISFFTLKSR